MQSAPRSNAVDRMVERHQTQRLELRHHPRPDRRRRRRPGRAQSHRSLAAGERPPHVPRRLTAVRSQLDTRPQIHRGGHRMKRFLHGAVRRCSPGTVIAIAVIAAVGAGAAVSAVNSNSKSGARPTGARPASAKTIGVAAVIRGPRAPRPARPAWAARLPGACRPERRSGSSGSSGSSGRPGHPGPRGTGRPVPGGALPTGKTIRGTYGVGGTAAGASSFAMDSIAFGFQLASPPAVHVIFVGDTPPPPCPGNLPALRHSRAISASMKAPTSTETTWTWVIP